jgi:hypothetical protein
MPWQESIILDITVSQGTSLRLATHHDVTILPFQRPPLLVAEPEPPVRQLDIITLLM